MEAEISANVDQRRVRLNGRQRCTIAFIPTRPIGFHAYLSVWPVGLVGEEIKGVES